MVNLIYISGEWLLVSKDEKGLIHGKKDKKAIFSREYKLLLKSDNNLGKWKKININYLKLICQTELVR